MIIFKGRMSCKRERVDGISVLRWILKKQDGMTLTDRGLWPDHVNRVYTSGSIKFERFLTSWEILSFLKRLWSMEMVGWLASEWASHSEVHDNGVVRKLLTALIFDKLTACRNYQWIHQLNAVNPLTNQFCHKIWQLLEKQNRMPLVVDPLWGSDNYVRHLPQISATWRVSYAMCLSLWD